MADKYIIGVTGNIATGKSLVLRMLKELGAETLDADNLVHVLMRRGSPLYDKIVAEFGRYILDEDFEIDRGRLGNIVFSDSQALAHLESITHPPVKREIKRWIAGTKASVVAVEAIKLIESGMADDCNAVWVVSASEDVQLERLMTKRKTAGPQAMLRIGAQPPQEEKIARADVVINNDGDVLLTWKIVQRHFAAIPRAVVPPPEPAAPVPKPVPPGQPVPPETLERLQVRRAKRSDLGAMSTLMGQATNGKIVPNEVEMMENLFSKGYFVAQADEQLLGMVGLRTENLIAGIDDFLVRSSDLWPTVGKELLKGVEKEAGELSCEVALLFSLPEAGPVSMAFFEKSGYKKKSPEELIKMWREAAEDFHTKGSVLMVKQLLERRIMTPI
ncbi:MAG: dephospho-CoA kinase [Anaerolineales bacterium]|nr:MAG: dephospho-CoA kinase [Anaerolineales bacterium]